MNPSTHQLLLDMDKGAEITAATSDGRTALHFASSRGCVEVVGLLLARGANVNAALAHRGRTALHCATQGGHIAVVQMLLTKGANTNSMDECDFTPLHWAAYKQHVEIGELLLGRSSCTLC